MRLLAVSLLLFQATVCSALEFEIKQLKDSIDQLVQDGIEAGQMSGAVVLIANHKGRCFNKATGTADLRAFRKNEFGYRFRFSIDHQTGSDSDRCDALSAKGEIDVNEKVSTYLPEFTGNGKESILVSELLLHTGGLIPDNSLKDYEDGPEIAWQKICNLDMTAARGEGSCTRTWALSSSRR